MAVESQIGQLVERIVRALVDIEEAVEVEERISAEGTTFTVKVAPTEIGKIVGKQGRTARSIRTILAAAGMKTQQRYSLNIVE